MRFFNRTSVSGLVAGGLIALIMGAPGQAAAANSDEEQLTRMKDPDQWPAPGRDFAMTRHSTLSDISTKNINKLQMIWPCAVMKVSPW